MKERKRKNFFPKSLIRSLFADIKNLMENNEGRLFALEIIEDIPHDLRPFVIESLSAFYDREFVVFLHLLKEEYGKELEGPINRALEKYQMAGICVEPPRFCRGEFYRAFATRSRHTGQVTVDVAWRNPAGTLDVDCFFLSYSLDGLHSSFAISDMTVQDYERERESLPDLIEISLAEASFLVQEAYGFNVKYMTRPGLGRFLFRKYLDMSHHLGEAEQIELLARISARLSPHRLVNSLFYARRRQDMSYIYSLLSGEKFPRHSLGRRLERLMNHRALLIEGRVSKTRVAGNNAVVKAYTISMDEEEVYHSEYSFRLKKGEDGWLIVEVFQDSHQIVSGLSELNPLALKVYCNVYEILDVEELLGSLDEVDNIREAGELPYGVHLRITRYEDDFEQGVFFLTGVLADLIINGDEMVIMAKDRNSLEMLHEIVTRGGNTVYVNGHEVSALTAYRYLSGQYLSFADVLAGSGGERFGEDGMRFLSARYVIRDWDGILAKLEKIRGVKYNLPGRCQVWYEYRISGKSGNSELVAEYVVGDNWITVSAFGDKELTIVRERFEKGIKECLEFEGMEIKPGGLFGILTREVREQYPQLEGELKMAYLEKWYRSNLKPLQGLSPAEARQSMEGRQLLWKMFKQMNLQRKARRATGVNTGLHLSEYIKKVGL